MNFLREFGIDEFIDYTKINAEEVAQEIDLVIDCVGGQTTGRFLRMLIRGGSLFPIFPLGFSGSEETDKLGVRVSSTQVRSSGAQLSEIASLLDSGTLRVVIDSTFPLSDARMAHDRAEHGSIQGKVVLTVDQS
ncbi:zinc-binding dehydrogenase [Pedobacter mendelii]|uniref:Zinc-binding dehydrogenase n=1 Tax=Pedobacter mendelii TaxID=1908240 RepID=A0ABQ2BM62_9SPHI|nr:zinc-binding dehydrogenase [Pedobacter mendelii]GGI29533.1 hypothetical protein GCM10008119_38100 [Pedobacter mendelii]